jgi:hypothetical protein
MRRSAALVGSIAIHVVLGALLLASRSREVAVDKRATPALEIVQADHAMLVDIVEQQANAGGGGSPTKPAERVARVEPRREIPVKRISSTENRGSVSDALGSMAVESRDAGGDGGDGGDGGGQGGGHGRGIGRGVGLGDGRVVTEQPHVATPVAPKASKARPAKLIYPKREGDASEGKLFVARITVDAEGYVVGANLLKGDGPYAGQAGGLIFRFRYLPALDDDGRPIRSTFDQQFLVQP